MESLYNGNGPSLNIKELDVVPLCIPLRYILNLKMI